MLSMRYDNHACFVLKRYCLVLKQLPTKKSKWQEDDGKVSCTKQKVIAQDCATSSNTSLNCRKCFLYKNSSILVPFKESFSVAAF
ncbi:hypothetical protein T11_7729, partial [Trichinella zimbabwensis]